MNKKIILILMVTLMIILTACSNNKLSQEEKEFYQENFSMSVYSTTFNGSIIKDYPDKVFFDNKLFNILNSASGEQGFEVDELKIIYKIELYNGRNISEYIIYNDGTVDMSYNLLNKSYFYLTETQLNKMIELIKS